MASDNKNNDFEKPNVDEEYLMNVISGDEPVAPPTINKKQDVPKENNQVLARFWSAMIQALRHTYQASIAIALKLASTQSELTFPKQLHRRICSQRFRI